MDVKNILVLGALGVAALALFNRGSNTVTQVGSGSLPGLSIAPGPVFNFGDGSGKYQGNGGYPPFNSCGCGRATGGIRLAGEISPVFASAIQTLPGVSRPQPINDPTPGVELVSNGVFT